MPSKKVPQEAGVSLDLTAMRKGLSDSPRG